MRRSVLVLLFCSAALVLAGCKKHETPPPVPRSQAEIDGCALLTKEETEAVQGSPIKETKSSARSDAAFLVSQCFYTATEFSKSVSLAVMQRDPGRPTPGSPKDFWKEKFGPYNANEKERDRKAQTKPREEKEEGAPPKKISGLGDDAYWVSNRFGGILYVFKGGRFHLDRHRRNG